MSKPQLNVVAAEMPSFPSNGAGSWVGVDVGTEAMRLFQVRQRRQGGYVPFRVRHHFGRERRQQVLCQHPKAGGIEEAEPDRVDAFPRRFKMQDRKSTRLNSSH